MQARHWPTASTGGGDPTMRFLLLPIPSPPTRFFSFAALLLRAIAGPSVSVTPRARLGSEKFTTAAAASKCNGATTTSVRVDVCRIDHPATERVQTPGLGMEGRKTPIQHAPSHRAAYADALQAAAPGRAGDWAGKDGLPACARRRCSMNGCRSTACQVREHRRDVQHHVRYAQIRQQTQGRS